MKIAFAIIENWPGNPHCYVRFEVDGERISLSYILTEKDARRFNTYDRNRTYYAGRRSGRFWGLEAAQEAVEREASERGVDYVFKGRGIAVCPWKILYPTSDLSQAANAIHERYEAFYHGCANPFPKHEEEMERLYGEWKRTIGFDPFEIKRTINTKG